MVANNRIHERLIALFLLGVLLVMPPVLLVFNRPDRVLGIPTLYLYVFHGWAGLIALTAAIAAQVSDAAEPDAATAPTAGAAPDATESPRDA